MGLDALSDAEAAAAVGNSMFSDLVSVAGHIYRFDIDDGLPGAAAGARIPINVHADEFNELMGDEFIPMVNKGGGAGVQVTAYTQTLSDIEARIGNRAKAGQGGCLSCATSWRMPARAGDVSCPPSSPRPSHKTTLKPHASSGATSPIS